MTNQEKLDVIQAHIDGKTIEISERTKGMWGTCNFPLFNFTECEYRIKEEPKELTPYEQAAETYGEEFEVARVYNDDSGYLEFSGPVVDTIETAVARVDFAGYVYADKEISPWISTSPAVMGDSGIIRPIAVLFKKEK